MDLVYILFWLALLLVTLVVPEGKQGAFDERQQGVRRRARRICLVSGGISAAVLILLLVRNQVRPVTGIVAAILLNAGIHTALCAWGGAFWGQHDTEAARRRYLLVSGGAALVCLLLGAQELRERTGNGTALLFGLYLAVTDLFLLFCGPQGRRK